MALGNIQLYVSVSRTPSRMSRTQRTVFKLIGLKSPPTIVPKHAERCTMYAALTSLDDTLALSNTEPRLNETDVGLALRNILTGI